MRDVSRLDKALEAAQGVARRPETDRLNGRLGEEAQTAALALMTEAGLTYADAYRVVDSLWWAGWAQGRSSGWNDALKTR